MAWQKAGVGRAGSPPRRRVWPWACDGIRGPGELRGRTGSIGPRLGVPLKFAAACSSSVGLQVANTLTVAVYLLFLILSRPYDDTIFQTYELITSAGQLAMMIIIMVGYFELVEAPQGAFIGVIVFILMGQIGNQVLSDGMSMGAHHIVKRL